jgi:hypothetical protein
LQAIRTTRRQWLKDSAAIGLTSLVAASTPHVVRAHRRAADDVTDIGTRLELFVDDQLIEKLRDVELRMHHPTPRDLALVHDAPWEGTGSGYHSVFQDDDRYRMYYKAWHLEVSQGKLDTGRHPLFCCYAESDDGITWRKPPLGLHEFEGSKQNNIVVASGKQGPLSVDAGHPAVFKDANPDAPPEGRYKAIFRSSGKSGLLPFQSPDGLHWSPMSEAPILAGLGAFDSQNLAFWDPTLGKYRAYWRIFTEGVTTDKVWKPGGIRAIRTATSDDLLHWSKPLDLTYVDSPPEQLYTNQIKPYYRAPHILIGFPTRYVDRGWSESMESLPEHEHRRMRSAATNRYGTAVTEGLLMASRDGVQFQRRGEAFLRPGPQRPGTWNYGHQYIAWHVVETGSSLPGADNELSLYAGESYWTGKASALRRYTLRIDGFVSASAPIAGGELLTRPIRFEGNALLLNFASSAAGGLRIEVQDTSGKAMPGFALDDCPAIYGDSLQRRVSWDGGKDLASLAGKPVQLRFELKDADLYAFRFQALDS